MKIIFAPVRSGTPLRLARKGDIVIVNDEEFDFSPLADGDKLPASAVTSQWFVGDVSRINGQLEVTIALPHGSKAPTETLFPQPMVAEGDGPITLPTYEV